MIGYDEDLDDEKLEAMQQHQNQQEEHRRIQKRQSQKKEKRDRVYAQKLHFVQQLQQGEGTRHQQQETILPRSRPSMGFHRHPWACGCRPCATRRTIRNGR